MDHSFENKSSKNVCTGEIQFFVTAVDGSKSFSFLFSVVKNVKKVDGCSFVNPEMNDWPTKTNLKNGNLFLLLP